MYVCMHVLNCYYVSHARISGKGLLFFETKLVAANQIGRLASRRLPRFPPHDCSKNHPRFRPRPYLSPFLPYPPPPLLTSAPPPRRRPPNLLRPTIPSAGAEPSTPVSRTFARCWPSASGAPRDGRPRPAAGHPHTPPLRSAPAGNPALPFTGAPTSSTPATKFHLLPDSPRLRLDLDAGVQILRLVLALAVRRGSRRAPHILPQATPQAPVSRTGNLALSNPGGSVWFLHMATCCVHYACSYQFDEHVMKD
jgi:hypothetical protein